jgi:hypothetical protein
MFSLIDDALYTLLSYFILAFFNFTEILMLFDILQDTKEDALSILLTF